MQRSQKRSLTLTVVSGLVAIMPVPVIAQDETMVSDDEMASVAEALEAIGCKASEVEKESDELYEIDDAACENGQFDIKFDGSFTLRSMIYDGAIDDDDEEIGATSEERVEVDKTLAKLGCEVEKVEKEAVNLFEIDDAVCEFGQYDMKINGKGRLLSMTYDGPMDD